MLNLRQDIVIDIGAVGRHSFQKGNYVYVGSAMKGLAGRISRHLRREKKFHWHIDYILSEARITGIYIFPNAAKQDECRLAKKIEEIADQMPVEKFGSSDCRCKTHLFFFKKDPRNMNRFREICESF